MNVGTKKINGVECEVHASAYGAWEIKDPDGASIGRSESTLDSAVNAARVTLNKRKVKVEVPFILVASGKRGVATGLHAGNRKVLITIDGERTQLEGYAKVLRPDTPDEKVARLGELRKIADDATRELGTIERAYHMDLRRAVDAAMTEAAS